jgi:hypothetical protein
MSESTTKERPILFSGPMVRAIIEGRKTQTRRIVKPQPGHEQTIESCPYVDSSWGINDTSGCHCHSLKCPYGIVGDRLWVRETWFCAAGEPGPMLCYYRADGDRPEFKGLWKPSIHMFRWASRITLEITSVKVERLQDIAPDDARAEGCNDSAWCVTDWPEKATRRLPAFYDRGQDGIVLTNFASLWQSINGPDSWDANPWVWVVEFKKSETSGLSI